MTTRPEPAFGDRRTTGRATGEDHRSLADRWSGQVDEGPDPVDDGIAVGVPPAPEAPDAPEGPGGPDAPAAGSQGAGSPTTESDQLRAERDEYLGALQRLQADFENYRKRVLRQQEEQAARASSSLVASVLPVLDTLDLAIAHLVGDAEPGPGEATGALEQARSQLLDVLGKEGLERVDAAGVAFDPSVHDAVARVEPDPAHTDPAHTDPAHTDPAHADRSSVAGTPAVDPDPSTAHDTATTDGTTDATSTGGTTDVPPPSSPMATIVDEVLRAGYRWRGQVLRPAMVRVRG